MKNYISIDGGTTNTRVSLVRGLESVGSVKIPLGARAGICGTEPLEAAIREAILSLLRENGLTETDIEKILASGMITSEFGLCKLDHISLPAGLCELHASMYEISLPRVSEIPFVFIRGVKRVSTPETLELTDMMRGEETELCGILRESGCETIYVLPGSHSKLIRTDKTGRIVDFSTMLTGEMIGALSGGTILADAVDLSVTELDEPMLRAGYTYAAERGINEALFKVRILKNLFGKTKEELYSFFLGVTLSAEIDSILASGAERVVIGGRAQIKRATALLLASLTAAEIVELDENEVKSSVTTGQIRIYEYNSN